MRAILALNIFIIIQNFSGTKSYLQITKNNMIFWLKGRNDQASLFRIENKIDRHIPPSPLSSSRKKKHF